MEIYILDNKNLNILSVCRPCNYNLNLDEETNGKSEIVLPSLNFAKKGFYLVFNGLYKQFLFVIDDVITSKEEKAVTVSLLDISNIFDRKIILRDRENMLTNGIENYIANEMDRNFINSNDSILNLNYVDVYVRSTTRANVTINDEDNLYNFHTYLINCRQYKNIYTEFKFEGITNRRLKIDIQNKSESTMLIDTTLAEVTGYNKVYEVDPVTKVEAYIRENGSIYNLYLKSDRTTTTNKNDVNRLEGRIETISCDTLENAQEEALNVIRANTYKHLVEFNIAKSSKLIDVKNLYIGRPIKIKTQDSIYDSYISAIILSDENFVQYKTGNLRIDFTDKQRLQQRSGIAGTKLDVSGGNVTGTLKVQGKEVATIEEGTRQLMNYYTNRPTTANLKTDGSGGLKVFQATGAMTEGKPDNDAHILHLNWDNTGGYDSQIAVSNNSSNNQAWIRAQNAGVWGNWERLVKESDLSAYTIPNNSTSSLWYKLGTVSLTAQGNVAAFKIFCGEGQNGNPYQNTIIELMIKRGWVNGTPSTVPTWAGGSYTIYSMASNVSMNNISVKLLSSEIGKVDVWIYFPWSYAAGRFYIDGDYSSFTYAGTTSSSEPTSGTKQNCEGGVVGWRTKIVTGSEVATNEYVDSKQVYVKRINCGNLPNTTTKTIATGLTMTSITVIKIIGACKTSAGITFPLPFLGIADNKSGDISVYIAADGNLTIKAYTDRSELAGYVNIYYTKN